MLCCIFTITINDRRKNHNDRTTFDLKDDIILIKTITTDQSDRELIIIPERGP